MDNVTKQLENVDRRMEKFEDGAQGREVRIAVLENNMSEIKTTLGDINTTMKTFMAAMDQKYATVIAFHELRQDIEKQLTVIQT